MSIKTALEAVLLASALCSCSAPEEDGFGPYTPPGSGEREDDGKTPDPSARDPIEDPDNVWAVIATRAESGLFALKLGEMMLASAGEDEEKRAAAHEKILFGMNVLLGALRVAGRFFRALEERNPGTDIDAYVKTVKSWSHDLMQARLKLPPDYARRLDDGKERRDHRKKD